MEGILSFLGGKVGIVAAAVGIPVAFFVAKKAIPKYFSKLASGALDKAFSGIDDIDDPVERQLVHDIAIGVVKWAEYKIPDKGQGDERFELAAEKLCKILPILKGRQDDIEQLIESAVEAMDIELKKAI